MRLIDAHSLIIPIALYMAENAYLNDTALDVLKKVAKWVETEPTIEAEPVRHGRWEYDLGDNIPYCNRCAMPQDLPTNYCHNCGAKMEKEKGGCYGEDQS